MKQYVGHPGPNGGLSPRGPRAPRQQSLSLSILSRLSFVLIKFLATMPRPCRNGLVPLGLECE